MSDDAIYIVSLPPAFLSFFYKTSCQIGPVIAKLSRSMRVRAHEIKARTQLQLQQRQKQEPAALQRLPFCQKVRWHR
jgi:hypothetical protein